MSAPTHPTATESPPRSLLWRRGTREWHHFVCPGYSGCRTTQRQSEIAAELETRRIPVLYLGNLFERDEVRDLLSLMSLVVDPVGDGLVRIAAMHRYGLAMQDLYLAFQWLKKSGKPALEALPDLSTVPGISPAAVTGLQRLASDFDGVEKATFSWEFLASYLLDRTDVVRQMARATSVRGQMGAVAVWQFLNFVREQSPVGSGLPIRRVLDRIRHIVLLAEERDLREVPDAALHLNAVKLLTVHGSKGLEFEAVHIPALTVSGFPLSYKGQRCPPPTGMIEGSSGTVAEDAKLSHEREEECLFFVAVSRARTHLVLHLCQKQDNGNKRNPSPFIEWVHGHASEVTKPAQIPLPADAPRPQPIEVDRPRGCRERVRIVDFVLYDDLDPNVLNTGIVRFDGRYFAALWDLCKERALTVVADVHTHPGCSEQSCSDQNHPMISRAGHLALIVPNFAAAPVRRREIGMYRYEGNKRWHRVASDERRSFFLIGI